MINLDHVADATLVDVNVILLDDLVNSGAVSTVDVNALVKGDSGDPMTSQPVVHQTVEEEVLAPGNSLVNSNSAVPVNKVFEPPGHATTPDSLGLGGGGSCQKGGKNGRGKDGERPTGAPFNGTFSTGAEYKNLLETPVKKYQERHIPGLYAIIIPSGGGKSSLAKIWGWIDVDDIIGNPEAMEKTNPLPAGIS